MINKFIENKISLENKKNYTLIIGSAPSKGARSPKLWNKAYKSFGKNIKMYPADLTKKNLRRFCKYLKSDKFFLGSSVTVPFKEEIMKYLDNIDKNAKYIGSVNTIKKTNGKLIGYNTDFAGSLDTLQKMRITKKEKKILFFGCGGAGKACLVSALKYFKNSKVFLISRSYGKIKNFLKKIKNINNNKIIYINNFKKKQNNISKIDLLINSTSVGFDSWFKNKKFFNLKNYSPLSKISFKETKVKNFTQFYKKNSQFIRENNKLSNNYLKQKKSFKIFDIIYKPKTSILLKQGEYHGHKTVNGLNMNLMQAVYAFKIVNNEKNITKIIKGMKN